MLDGLLGRGFSSKCKLLIKATRTRIDVVRRRKEATQRFLKGNLAQLLSNGLDINAFGRTEEFLAGLNLLACYDFLEQSCEHILKKLSTIHKQSECPEECREAVGSLMFAAARFSDLPELRDLRDALQERYESSLEHFVNQEFFERLELNTPTIDKKIQLLVDIASELSINWDSRGFQQRMMANPSVPAQNQVKKQDMIHNRGTSLNLHKDNETAINPNKRDQLVKEKNELNSDWLKAKNGGENTLMRKDEVGHQSFKGVESTGNGGMPHMGGEHRTAERENYDMTPRGRREKGELSSDVLQAKNGVGNYLMRKYELNNLSSGQGKSPGNSGKPSMGSEHNTHRRDNCNVTLGSRLEEGEFSNTGLRGKNGRGNYLARGDVSDILLFERDDSMGNSRKSHTHSEKNTPRRENYGNIPVGSLEEVHFSSNDLRAKSGRDNYFLKDELDHLRGSDSMGNSHRPHIGSEEKTPRREIYDIKPHSRREVTVDKNESTQINEEEDSVHRRNEHGSSSRGKRPDVFDELNASYRETYSITPSHRREYTDEKNEFAQINGKYDTVSRRERHGSSSRGKMPEVTDDIYEAQNNKVKSYSYDLVANNKPEELPITRDGKNVSSTGYRDYKEPNAAQSPKVTQREDTDLLKPNSSYALPPPYVKSKDKFVPSPYVKMVDAKTASSNHGGVAVEPTIHKRDDMKGRSEKVRLEEHHSDNENLQSWHARVGSNGHEKEVSFRDNIPLPKPRSIRRKHSKPSSNRDDPGDSEDSEVTKRSSSSRRRDHHSRKGLQILFGEDHKQRDDEDRKLDKLLMHYSKKPSTYVEEKVKRKIKVHTREAPHNGFIEGEASVFPTRSVSFPHEQLPKQEQVKVYARANSFQPDKPAGHVHPKLPDCDDLAAQFAALKGR